MLELRSNLPTRFAGAAMLAVVVLTAAIAGRAAGDNALENGASEQDDLLSDLSSRDATLSNGARLITAGRSIFRGDTFGNEAFWTGRLRLHDAIAGQALGGVGPGVSPNTALALGLKVDLDRLPGPLRLALRKGAVNLDNPAVTLALLGLDAVVGVRGQLDQRGRLTSVGITCAFCHSTVDDSFGTGIGHRLDGWPNRDLNVGAIIAAAPDLTFFTTALGVDDATVRAVLSSWGPGRFDASLLLDGKAFRPDGKTGSVLIPAAFGLAGVNLHTYTGWGGISHWNALVANVEMGGRGVFYDPRLNDAARFPIAAKLGLGNLRNDPDLVTSKLPALQLYQLALKVPSPPATSFDREAARRGRDVFNTAGQCSRCHVPPLFTEPGWNLHTPEEIGIDAFQASRGPEDRYRTTPLGGLFTRFKGGLYHDGRFATVEAVVDHYDRTLALGLTGDQKRDLVQYLKSL
jgi:hypothetical protein